MIYVFVVTYLIWEKTQLTDCRKSCFKLPGTWNFCTGAIISVQVSGFSTLSSSTAFCSVREHPACWCRRLWACAASGRVNGKGTSSSHWHLLFIVPLPPASLMRLPVSLKKNKDERRYWMYINIHAFVSIQLLHGGTLHPLEAWRWWG